jgi:hypothetical protein
MGTVTATGAGRDARIPRGVSNRNTVIAKKDLICAPVENWLLRLMEVAQSMPSNRTAHN